MKIIILGAGRVGTTLAEHLCREHDVYLIDKNEKELKKIGERLDVQVLAGPAADPVMLESIGADTADMLVAVTCHDETNIFACQLAYCLFNIPTKIARIRSPHLNKYIDRLKKDLFYVDMMIDPAELVTKRLLRKIEHPGTFIVLDFVDNSVQVASIKIDYACVLVDQTIEEISSQLSKIPHKLVCIVRNEKIIPIKDTEHIYAHDELYFCCEKIRLNEICNIIFGKEIIFKRIMIGGGGNIGIKLAKKIEESYKVKVIENNTERVTKVAEKLSHTIVLNGDISDSELLTSENIDEVDLFCSVTNDDENNIMSAIIAKRLGAKQTITLVNRQTYAHYLIERSSDIDIAISPQLITCSGILKYLRRTALANAYILPEGMAEVVELVIHENEKTAEIIGKSLSALNIPKECIICCIAREQSNELLFNVDEQTIQPDDHLVAFVSDRTMLNTLEKRFRLEESIT
jgi:trk system potassium uptake protein